MTIRFFLVLSFFVPYACYAESPQPVFCSDTDTDGQGIYECSRRKNKDADIQLNRTYKALNNKIDIDYKVDPQLGASLKEHVKKSQRAWIILRDENCAIESFMISPGTQAFETTKNLCMARESIERIHYLNNLKL